MLWHSHLRLEVTSLHKNVKSAIFIYYRIYGIWPQRIVQKATRPIRVLSLPKGNLDNKREREGNQKKPNVTDRDQTSGCPNTCQVP